MKSAFKNALRNWLPPVFVRWLIKLMNAGNRFYGDYATWEEAEEKSSGYSAELILEKVLAAAIKVKNGDAVYERDSVIFNHIEYSWPVTAALMWAAARKDGRLNVLDFGGSLGSSYFQNRLFLQSLPQVNWSVVEQSHYIEAGQKHIQYENLKFYKTIDECTDKHQPNVILLSSVLQYLPDPIDIVTKLTATKATLLIIDRTPFSSLDVDKILIQKVPSSIYSASYPMRVFSREKFLEKVKCDWELITEIVNPDGNIKSTAGIEFTFQGMILELKN
jgi:putative methyltransferase (TIGR04325 family)